MLHVYILIKTRPRGYILYSVGYTADLILPPSTGAHNLLHAENSIVEVFFSIALPYELKDPFYACCREDGACSKPASLRYADHLCIHDEAAAKLIHHRFKTASVSGDDSAREQRCLLKNKRIEWITYRLKSAIIAVQNIGCICMGFANCQMG